VLPELRAKLAIPSKPFAERLVVKAEKYHLTNNTTSFEVNAPTPGLAVLMEANVPQDIRAYVDGQSAPCLSVNYAFRGVFIEKPGRHVVKFAYWPRVLVPALWVGLVGLCGLLLSVWAWWRSPSEEAGTVPAEAMAPTCLTNSP